MSMGTRIGVMMGLVTSGLLVGVRAQAQVFPPTTGSPSAYAPPQAPPQTNAPQPGAGQTGAVQPGTVQPGTVQPGTVQPGTVQPGTVQPGTVQPGTVQPGTVQPGTVQPGTVQPTWTQPEVVQPAGTQPMLGRTALPQSYPPPGSGQTSGKGDAEPEPKADHDRFVGRLGVTVFDLGTGLPIATASATPGDPNYVNTPVIGIRYWFLRDMGVDLGVGVGWSSTSTSTTTGGVSKSTDQPSPFGMAFHAGLPLALLHAHHYSFLFIPETSVGFTSETVKGTGTIQDQSLTGVGFQFGARTGAEIHFGFIGVPQLALQATVGLMLQYGQFGWSQGNSNWSTSQWSLQTTVGAHPWSVFTDNIAATYYF